MKTSLTEEGQIVIPKAIREGLRLVPGDEFEISLESDDTISFRRISRPPNQGLVDHLLSCPEPLKFAARPMDFPRNCRFPDL